jgi:hypothetical protein
MARKNTLQINFQRNTSRPEMDDVLRVSSDGNGWVRIQYTDKSANVKNLSYMKEAGFMSYMEALFRMLKYDDAPYPFVQISAPCYPQILIKSADFKNEECFETLGYMLSSCWRIWYPFTSQTSDADDDVEMDEQEDEEMDTHQWHGCYCNQD